MTPQSQTSPLLHETESKPVRFHLIDGLRGIAAVSVLIYHLWVNAGLRRPLSVWCPSWLDHFFALCHHGIEIFFVLSGFVIAYSVRDLKISLHTATNFALRRQLRLDPPYWLCTLLTLIPIALASHKNPGLVIVPSVGAFFANLFYLQGILGLPFIVRPSWTLCLEIQFYLVFIAAVWLAQRFRNEKIAATGVFLASVCVSLVWCVRYPPTPWFIGSWYLFAIGVWVYWTFAGRMQGVWLFAVVLATLCLSLFVTPNVSFVGACTALLLFHAGRRDHLHDWLSAPIFRYFGAISYSLYLVHFDLVSLVARAGMRLTGDSPRGAVVWFSLAIGLSVFAAHLLHHFIEKPAMRFAARFKSQP